MISEKTFASRSGSGSINTGIRIPGKHNRKHSGIFILLFGFLLLAVMGAIVAGSYSITPGDAVFILKTKLLGGDESLLPKLQTVILWNIRLPRILLAVFTGMAFSVSGTVYQACFRNPLADPYILGVSAGASFGAALGIMFPAYFPSVRLTAFVCALGSVALSWGFARTRGRVPGTSLVISGMVVASLFSALVSLLKYIAPDSQLREITFWMMGGLYFASWQDLAVTVPVVLLTLGCTAALAWKLNVLSLGDHEARTLGVNPGGYRLLFITMATLSASLCVSQTGIIPWVGLMMPHGARLLFGADNSRVIPGSALLGALFMLGCDTLARTLTEAEIPIGIVTSIAGAPFLVYLLRTKGQAVYE
ncbi:FecCD family ABC transporter permease [Breznakiella homolactica]|uniref:Iron ABC transporter permease n=1 Tax=Breznakiella homolactica TaxID=2798577 RepID=A0A7T8B8X4_9SPIR|nr:iron ABC transporter permease [Breznakiella homolactica]QQO07761.1 iron ABC transporter permease [Breznakiella homolactica]